jgi:hypothetical protein
MTNFAPSSLSCNVELDVCCHQSVSLDHSQSQDHYHNGQNYEQVFRTCSIYRYSGYQNERVWLLINSLYSSVWLTVLRTPEAIAQSTMRG